MTVGIFANRVGFKGTCHIDFSSLFGVLVGVNV